jgi:hypothetical protein
MVGHPWYVFHIPYTNAYVPIWAVALIALLLFAVAASVIFAIGLVFSPRQTRR